MFSRHCYLIPTAGCFGKNPCCSFVLFSGAYLRALAVTGMEAIKKKLKALSVGCFGCSTKPSVNIAVGDRAKGLHIQDNPMRKYGILDDFWSSSTAEMDDSAVKSQKSLSPVSPLNQPLDFSSNRKSTNNPAEFVNHGLLLWNQTRQQWLGNKRSGNRTQPGEPTISLNATYESLLGTNHPFRQPVPLAEMVDFLVDVWEQEGLHD